MSKAYMTCISESIPEDIVCVKMEIDVYNNWRGHQTEPELSRQRKEAL
jgi:hypothetical protein